MYKTARMYSILRSQNATYKNHVNSVWNGRTFSYGLAVASLLLDTHILYNILAPFHTLYSALLLYVIKSHIIHVYINNNRTGMVTDLKCR